MKFPVFDLFLCLLLVGTVALIGDRSGYDFPPRGKVTLEQARLLTPSNLAIRFAQNDSFDPLKKQIGRFGLFDDAALAGLILAQLAIAGLGVWSLRKTRVPE